jgi:YVTN family beta-propeller protein
MRRTRGASVSAWVVLALCVGGACNQTPARRQTPLETQRGRVDVFLRCTDPSPRTVELEFASVELRSDSGTSVPLALSQSTYSSAELARRLPLAGGSVPPASYTALVLRFRGARLQSADGPIELRLSTPAAPELEAAPALEATLGNGEALLLPLRARLGRQDALALFVDWNVPASLSGGADFAPVLTLSTERPRASLGLLYAVNESAGSVLAIDRSSGEVVATYKVGSRPRAAVLARDRRRLFVASSGDGTLDVLDVQQGSVASSVPFGASARSQDVALGSFDRVAAIAQRDLNRVSIVDAATGSRLADVPVGRAPSRLVSAPLLQRLYVVSGGSDTVDVVDLQSYQVIAQLPTEARPTDAVLDRRERELYVAHAVSPNLLVYDAATLAQRASIHVGSDMTALLADRRRDRIYVARTHPHEIVVVDRELGSVLRRIPIAGRVQALAQPLEGAEIVGAAPELGALIVVDVVIGAALESIRCGGSPTDVVSSD